jgi:hypothetical protein
MLCSLVDIDVSEENATSIFRSKNKLSKKANSLLGCTAYSSTLKLETVSFSGTLINLYQTMRHHFPEENAFHVFYELPLLANPYHNYTVCL